MNLEKEAGPDANGTGSKPLNQCPHSSAAVVRCRRCRRPLSSQAALRRGYGWRCNRHLRTEEVAA